MGFKSHFIGQDNLEVDIKIMVTWVSRFSALENIWNCRTQDPVNLLITLQGSGKMTQYIT